MVLGSLSFVNCWCHHRKYCKNDPCHVLNFNPVQEESIMTYMYNINRPIDYQYSMCHQNLLSCYLIYMFVNSFQANKSSTSRIGKKLKVNGFFHFYRKHGPIFKKALKKNSILSDHSWYTMFSVYSFPILILVILIDTQWSAETSTIIDKLAGHFFCDF